VTEQQAGAVAPTYQLQLFVAGSNLRSRRAIETLQHICEHELSGEANLEIIDIYQQPELADRYQVVAAPTLVRMLPLPVRHLIGDLAKIDRVLQGLQVNGLRP
jgi:circadian clock protein KaiB